MNNLYEKLNRELAHTRLSPAEKNAMRAAIFGAPSPVVLHPSRIVFVSQRWMTALAALVLVVFAGGSTAFAAEGSLPGQPLYAVKTNILEPVQVALAPNAAAKAAAHVAIAQARVAEAEALVQKGSLDATTSAALADNFEIHAQSAAALADEVSGDDPATAAEIKAQLGANATVGSAVLAALGREHGDGNEEHANAIAVRVLARAGSGGGRAVAAFAPAPQAALRAFSATGATSTQDSARAESASINGEQQKTAAQLQMKAQAALNAVRAQFTAASSTLDASTTVSVEASLAGIDASIQSGSQALADSQFDTAVSDFTQALGRALRLSALLQAQQKFDNHTLDSLFKSGDRGDSGGDSGSGDSNQGSGGSDSSGETFHTLDLHL